MRFKFLIKSFRLKNITFLTLTWTLKYRTFLKEWNLCIININNCYLINLSKTHYYSNMKLINNNLSCANESKEVVVEINVSYMIIWTWGSLRKVPLCFLLVWTLVVCLPGHSLIFLIPSWSEQILPLTYKILLVVLCFT